MSLPELMYDGAMFRGRRRRKEIADLIAKKFTREALDEAIKERALDKEYGPRIYPKERP